MVLRRIHKIFPAAVIIVLFAVVGWLLFVIKEKQELIQSLAAVFEPPKGSRVVYTPAQAQNLIRVSVPLQDDRVSSPLSVRGKARGGWYFEATFPVVLTDWDGRIIVQSFATARGDWMTEEFVPFEGTFEFEKPKFGERGFLILKRSNASGLPEHDAAAEVPIFFE